MQTSDENSQTVLHSRKALQAFAMIQRIEPGLITRLICECELFTEICDDYEECSAKLLSLEEKGVAVEEQVRDYREMRTELERELRRCLRGPAECRTCQRRTKKIIPDY